MLNLRDMVCSDQTIVIEDDKQFASCFGPNLLFHRCEIVIQTTSSGIIFSKTEFHECRIIARRKLKGYRWFDTYFRRCQFLGSYADNIFGAYPDMGRPNLVEECDFSAAKLDAQILNSDLCGTKFPSWPYFTVRDPAKHANAIHAIDWPGKSRILGEVIASFGNETSSLTIHGLERAKKYGISEDDLKKTVTRIPGIIL